MIFSISAWRVLLPCALVLMLAGLSATRASSPLAQASELDAVRTKVRAALQRRDPIAAEVPLREAISKGADEDALRALLGEALLARGERSEALKVLEAGDFTPDTAALGWRMRGQARLGRGDLKGAAQAFDQAYRFAPDDAELWVAIATLRFSGGEQAQAFEAADRAVRLDPRNPRALNKRGLLVRDQFGLAAALPWFEAGLKVAPEDPTLLGEYAATLGEMGAYRAMLVVCRKLVTIDPKNARAASLQAILAARAGKSELARAILGRTGTALRDVPAMILLSGVLEYRAGNTNLAGDQFERLVRLQPDNLQARQLLARVLLRQGQAQQVVERFDVAARAPGASPYLMQVVGQAWRMLGDEAQADALFALVRSPESRAASPLTSDVPLGVAALRYAEAPNAAAAAVPYIRALIGAGRGDEAQAAADRLKAANPGFADAHLLAGDLRILRADPAGALRDYEKASTIHLSEPVFTRMDAALRALGKPLEADAMTGRYLKQNPQSLAAMKRLDASWRKAGRVDAAASMALALAARGQPASLR
ncbi:tetratricopeptide repeat protein [Novosphingobium sp. Chol11]|uniref:tetratricopeptide repeat protein n=1 Tax=Novosphingobium sp. Chol11 TaxID=1385763 RepID=UPI0025D0FD7F|nr:tetratricopeptide repeat protein [Novosphingobium sp. Chol11]